jgi:hypothetical protein
MAKKAQSGDVNRSALIREMFAQNPDMKVKDIVAILKQRGVIVAPNLVYLVKGKLKGEKPHGPKDSQAAPKAAAALGGLDALATIHKVKKLALDVGGLRMLKGIVDALSE